MNSSVSVTSMGLAILILFVIVTVLCGIVALMIWAMRRSREGAEDREEHLREEDRLARAGMLKPPEDLTDEPAEIKKPPNPEREMESILKELKGILPAEDVDMVKHLLEYDEWGVGFENLLDQLFERSVKVSPEMCGRFKGLNEYFQEKRYDNDALDKLIE